MITMESIFESWDGCIYDGIDIGAALRADFSKLPAAAPQVVADERTLFEASEPEMNLARDAEGEYKNPCVASAWKSWQDRAALDAAPVEAQEPVIQMLLDVALHAYLAMDNTEENDTGMHWYKPDFDDLSAAMDKLDSLPDDRPGYVMGPAAKAAWALRHRAPVQPVAVPDGGIYQVALPGVHMGLRWYDVVKVDYDASKPDMRRIVFAAPAAQGDVKDAERYRHLRSKESRDHQHHKRRALIAGIQDWSRNIEPNAKFGAWSVDYLTGDALDAAIDAAIAAKAAS